MFKRFLSKPKDKDSHDEATNPSNNGLDAKKKPASVKKPKYQTWNVKSASKHKEQEKVDRLNVFEHPKDAAFGSALETRAAPSIPDTKQVSQNAPAQIAATSESVSATPTVIPSAASSPFLTQPTSDNTPPNGGSAVGTIAVKAIALYNFNPGQPDEIVLSKGDKLTVAERDPSGWWTGKNETTGAFGLFPGGFVRLLEERDGPPSQTSAENADILHLENENQRLEEEVKALKLQLEQSATQNSSDRVAELEAKLEEEIANRKQSESLVEKLNLQIEELKNSQDIISNGGSSIQKDSEKIERLRNRVLELQKGFMADKKRFEDINGRLQAEIIELRKKVPLSDLSISSPREIQKVWARFKIDEITDINKLKETLKEIQTLHQQEIKQAQEKAANAENSFAPIKKKLEAEISELKALLETSKQ